MDRRLLYRDRMEACVEIWGLILDGSLQTREAVRGALEEYYTARGIEPIRGKSKIDLFDKEMATLYIVGKYGLGLSKEAEQAFSKIFALERKCERAYYRVLEGEDPRVVMEEVFGSHDSSLIFRVLRFAVTLTLLGFAKEDDFLRVLHRFAEAYPEYANRFPLFARFYVALRLGEAIALYQVRNNVEKEALKHALCMRVGFGRCAPPDDMVYDIARSIYKVSESRLKQVLPKSKASEAR